MDQSERIRIVFFGTPEYAVPTLRVLATEPRFDVLLAVTQPDRKAGRGHHLLAPSVKSAAEELGVRVIQPPTLRDESVRDHLRALDADLFVVAAYGLIFSQAILDIPSHGCLNLHASLLPHYRGAAPIPAAILNGDLETGVTLMMMERGLDTGPLVAMSRTRIEPHDTTESLTARLAVIGAGLAADAIPALVSGRIEPIPQSEGGTAVRQLTKADGQIDWRKSTEQIERQVRAMWPWPRAWTRLGERTIQIHAASRFASRSGATAVHRNSVIGDPPSDERQVETENKRGVPGRVRIVDDHPAVICGDDELLIIEQGQLPGSKPNSGPNLIRGRALHEGDQFNSTPDPITPLIRPAD